LRQSTKVEARRHVIHVILPRLWVAHDDLQDPMPRFRHLQRKENYDQRRGEQLDSGELER
jgi:hypothetical protein